MKYIKPTIEIFALEARDILTASSDKDSISSGGVTITGEKEEFFANFSDLLGK